jgi:hypothetical protein
MMAENDRPDRDDISRDWWRRRPLAIGLVVSCLSFAIGFILLVLLFRAMFNRGN